MSSEECVTLGDLAAALGRRFPSAWAEEWDRVGLVIGDPSSSIRGVLVTLDATAEAVARATDAGANVVVTHHPPFLTPPESVARTTGPDGTLDAALRAEAGVISLHTNLDRSPEGAEALARLLGLEVLAPLESGTERVVVIVTYAPTADIDAIRDAMARAGAGRLGEYERCGFASEGRGYFSPLEGAHPSITGGRGVAEVRLEMVASPGIVDAALAAGRAAHPYEEPVILAVPAERARGVARLGRVVAWREGATVEDLARHVAGTLGCACRVWGDASRAAGRIAVANGSASSLMLEARRSADTLIAGEVRYHDALAASAAGLTIIEGGHDATEWPMVGVLGAVVREIIDEGITVTVEAARTGWWTTEVGR